VDQGQQSIARFKEQAALVRETLRGYAHAATVVERERMEQWRIETLLAVRDAMARVSKSMSDKGTSP